MAKDYYNFLKERLNAEALSKLEALENPKVVNFVGEYVELCNPKSLFIRTDSFQDAAYIREKALCLGEEKEVSLKGHSIHFDGAFDQARDKKGTKYLTSGGQNSGCLNSIGRQQGREEVRSFLSGIMKDREMFVCFFCLGPVNSDFSVLAVQITDSAYVAHSEDILYRSGYEQFKKRKGEKGFFSFVHSSGELENNVSKNVDKRRVYIDLEDNLVYSVNTQYAGNTVGLKKLALRLAIKKAYEEGWLAEHMFLMGISGGNDDKKTYFCGAYPSMCGKTSTALLSGETIIGDDIAYLRVKNGAVYAVNVERGIFGIIKDVNSKDDPVLFKTLAKQGEIIFSNILIDEERNVFWAGKSKELPSGGVNYSGPWFPGKTDEAGSSVPPSHKNARYTLRLEDLENVDENLENPQGVKVKGLIYGGRDSDTSVPVEQAFSWQQGIITKAAGIESETTAATLGREGVRVFNPMSNMDFLSIPLGKYLEMNLKFAEGLSEPPLIFLVNYFLKNKKDEFLNEMQDKQVWLKWMRLRTEGKAAALLTPTGLIPEYGILKELFKQVLRKEYSEADYIEQFTLRIPENLAKIERIRKIYEELEGIPSCLFDELKTQSRRLEACREKYGDYVAPDKFKLAEVG